VPADIQIEFCENCGNDFKIAPPYEKVKVNLNHRGDYPSQVSKEKEKRLDRIKMITIFSVLITILGVFAAFRSLLILTQSYYIASDSKVGDKSHNDHAFVKEGSFYRLRFAYPDAHNARARLFGPKFGTMYCAQLTIVAKDDYTVRYRINSLTLRGKGGKTYASTNYQMAMTQDIIDNQGIGAKDVKAALEKTTMMVPHVDFGYDVGSIELLYGYNFIYPPADLILNLDVEIYTFDHKLHQDVKEEIRLKRAARSFRDMR